MEMTKKTKSMTMEDILITEMTSTCLYCDNTMLYLWGTYSCRFASALESLSFALYGKRQTPGKEGNKE
jgi:hypothetical protein